MTALEEIPQGHKFALKPIAQGGEVIKYGFRIGNAKEDIPAGGWVHVHNLKTALEMCIRDRAYADRVQESVVFYA